MNMSMTKVKAATAAALGAVMAAALVGGSFLPAVFAQERNAGFDPFLTQRGQTTERYTLSLNQAKPETDDAFIRRVSKDLREADPTPAEVHFFLSSKEPGKRQKLIDLFIEERIEKQKLALRAKVNAADKRGAEKEAATETVVLKYASADEVAGVLAKVYAGRGVKVVVEAATNRLLVRGDRGEVEEAKKLAEQMDGAAKPRERNFGGFGGPARPKDSRSGEKQ